MADDQKSLVRGVASEISPFVQDLLKQDDRTNLALSATGNYVPDERKIGLQRYCDQAFADLERDRVWAKVWQYACREEDIPNVGDRIVYEVAGFSYLIVRCEKDEFKAFHNACRHRGTRLCDGHSTGEKIRCPFHAWEWNLNGSVSNIPGRWDFPKVDNDAARLKEAGIGRWGGFIFVNPSPEPKEALYDVLGVLPKHFESWPLEDRYTISHVKKKVRANWKITMEAFLESYHALEVHPQIMSMLADSSTQYDIWEDGISHVSRLYSPQAVPSPYFGNKVSLGESARELADSFKIPGFPDFQLDPNSTKSPRAQVADWRRKIMGECLARDFSQWPDAVMLDAIQYWSFPNFGPWYGEGGPIVYKFLPGPTYQESVIEVRILAPKPGGAVEPPPSAPVVYLDYDEPFSNVEDYVTLFGGLDRVFDQDMANIPRVQAGLTAAYRAGAEITCGRYQESRITHFHEVLDKYLGL